MRTIQYIIALFCLIFILNTNAVRASHIIVEPSTLMVDGTSPPYNSLKPGDTVYFRGGERKYLMIRNFTGDSRIPFYFMNYNGTVLINTDWYYGIVLQNCRYVRLSGTGDSKYFYGFMITRVKGGAGVSVGTLSSDFELDHLYISNTPIAGIYAKTDPDCSYTSTRDKFTQSNTIIHDCYISNVGNEGMYVGSSFYSGENINCNGKDTVVYPSLLGGVRIYNNIVRFTGWDGIQVGSASQNCKIYNNLVEYDSQAGVQYQMSGILIGGGSRCDCYNNYIYKGKGDGIESLGLGGYRIYNNIIVDAGWLYYPGDPDKPKHGIYQGDVSTLPNASFEILFNDIINPKSSGIKFASIVSKNNLIASNVIINPGSGSGSYIDVANPGNVLQKNNYKAMNKNDAGFRDTLYALKQGSPLIDAGYQGKSGVIVDYSSHPRPNGSASDIGAQEYDGSTELPKKAAPSGGNGEGGLELANLAGPLTVDPVVFRNPSGDAVTIKYHLDTVANIVLDVYSMDGNRVFHKEEENLSADYHNLVVNVQQFPEGVYVYSLRMTGIKTNGKHTYNGRFYKIK